ncbi:MAG: GNAT family N-acetyltransferase [Motiliproteus sp.]
MQVQIKRATFDDVGKVAPLFDQYRVFYRQPSDLQVAANFIGERLQQGSSVIFLAVAENDQAVGFTQLFPTFSSITAKPCWTLADLYVVPQARRANVAKMLMNTAKAFAVETGAQSLALETAVDNIPAQMLYQSLGYQREQDYYTYFLNLEVK